MAETPTFRPPLFDRMTNAFGMFSIYRQSLVRGKPFRDAPRFLGSDFKTPLSIYERALLLSDIAPIIGDIKSVSGAYRVSSRHLDTFEMPVWQTRWLPEPVWLETRQKHPEQMGFLLSPNHDPAAVSVTMVINPVNAASLRSAQDALKFLAPSVAPLLRLPNGSYVPGHLARANLFSPDQGSSYQNALMILTGLKASSGVVAEDEARAFMICSDCEQRLTVVDMGQKLAGSAHEASLQLTARYMMISTRYQSSRYPAVMPHVATAIDVARALCEPGNQRFTVTKHMQGLPQGITYKAEPSTPDTREFHIDATERMAPLPATHLEYLLNPGIAASETTGGARPAMPVRHPSRRWSLCWLLGRKTQGS